MVRHRPTRNLATNHRTGLAGKETSAIRASHVNGTAEHLPGVDEASKYGALLAAMGTLTQPWIVGTMRWMPTKRQLPLCGLRVQRAPRERRRCAAPALD